MIVVRIELHSAITGKVSEIGRMVITNDGTGSASTGHYDVKLGRRACLARTLETPQRRARVESYPRKSAQIWVLVARALKELGFK